jgi:hypothetical protein
MYVLYINVSQTEAATFHPALTKARKPEADADNGCFLILQEMHENEEIYYREKYCVTAAFPIESAVVVGGGPAT